MGPSEPGFLQKRASRDRNQAEFRLQFRRQSFAFATQSERNKPSHLNFEQLHRFKKAPCHAIEGLRQF
jgi:hypothetical protein